jgi:tyrosyl-tRNA synthetase
VLDNHDWTRSVTLLEFLRDVGKHVTVNQMVGRESVRARLDSTSGISFTEFSYMLLQAFDFVHLHRARRCELQIGGSDQWGNIVTGIDLIRKTSGAHTHGLTWPLLLRADGRKFGKSEAGNVWLAPHRTSPFEFFQYWMQVPDSDVRRFLLQLTLLPVAECTVIADAHDEAPERREGQRRLAHEITGLVHGPDAAAAAEEASLILFGGSPLSASAEAFAVLADEVPTSGVVPADGPLLADVVAGTPLARSLSDARRSLAQGALYVNGERADGERRLSAGDLLHDRWILLRKGKRTHHLLDAG